MFGFAGIVLALPVALALSVSFLQKLKLPVRLSLWRSSKEILGKLLI